MITSNLNLVRDSVKKLKSNVDIGARNARDEMMNTLIQLSKEEIKGKRPYQLITRTRTTVKGEKGSTYRRYNKATVGQPPMNRLGHLRGSIRGQRYNLGFAKYNALVGPQAIYGRQVEIGGGSWSAGTKFPYMSPAFQKFKSVAPAIVKKHIKLGG